MAEGKNPYVSGNPQIRGKQRDDLRARVVELYNGNAETDTEGMSVRGVIDALAKEMGAEKPKSYGFVHRLLAEAVRNGELATMRSHGSWNRAKEASGE